MPTVNVVIGLTVIRVITAIKDSNNGNSSNKGRLPRPGSVARIQSYSHHRTLHGYVFRVCDICTLF